MRPRTPRPPEDAYELGLHYLEGALSDLISARLAMSPSARTWSPPTSALQGALGEDAEAARCSRHLREVEDRLREMLGPEREGHIDELCREIRDYEIRCAEIGWMLGVEAVVRRPVEA